MKIVLNNYPDKKDPVIEQLARERFLFDCPVFWVHTEISPSGKEGRWDIEVIASAVAGFGVIRHLIPQLWERDVTLDRVLDHMLEADNGAADEFVRSWLNLRRNDLARAWERHRERSRA